MGGRLRIWLAVAISVAVFITFLAHKPACSSGNMLHNKPVPKFRALSADVFAKSGIAAPTEFTVTRPAVTLVSPPMEALTIAADAPRLGMRRPQVLSCCFLC